MNKLVTGLIRVVIIPNSEAPIEISKKWVGEEFPVNAIHNDSVRGVVTGKKSRSGIMYNVDQTIALEILSHNHPDAAQWWYEHGFPQAGKNFAFRQEEVVVVGKIEEVKPVIRMWLGLDMVGVGAQDANW